MPPRSLFLDLGNSSLKGRVFEGSREIHAFRRFKGGGDEADLAAALRGVTRVFGAASRGLPRIHGLPVPEGLWAGFDFPLPGDPAYDRPEEMGPDRRLACHALRVGAGGGLVLDAGTCLTASAVDPEGRIYGLAIAPGFGALVEAVSTSAPGLRLEVEMARGGSAIVGDEVPRDTEGNLRTGLAAAFRGTAREVLVSARSFARRAKGVPDRLWLTGGDAARLREVLGEGEVVPDLVCRGLRLWVEELGLANGGKG